MSLVKRLHGRGLARRLRLPRRRTCRECTDLRNPAQPRSITSLNRSELAGFDQRPPHQDSRRVDASGARQDASNTSSVLFRRRVRFPRSDHRALSMELSKGWQAEPTKLCQSARVIRNRVERHGEDRGKIPGTTGAIRPSMNGAVWHDAAMPAQSKRHVSAAPIRRSRPDIADLRGRSTGEHCRSSPSCHRHRGWISRARTRRQACRLPSARGSSDLLSGPFSHQNG